MLEPEGSKFFIEITRNVEAGLHEFQTEKEAREFKENVTKGLAEIFEIIPIPSGKIDVIKAIAAKD